MLIDCNTCAVRDISCDDCVVTALLGPIGADEHVPRGTLDDDERRALDVLAESGLVPRLRLVPLGVPGAAAPHPRTAAS